MKTPISYYGGKQRIASQIVEVLESIPHTVYVEPFSGGLAVLYAKRLRGGNSHYYREAINDINQCLITFWRVARDSPDELQRYLELTPYSQEEHRVSQQIYNNPSEYDEIKIAWAVYIQCNMSFANKIKAGWGTQTMSHNSAATWHNHKANLPQAFERLEKVHIGCEDALKFIKRWDSPQTLHYVDPPYPNASQGHYKGYTLDDYQALCDALDNCQGSYVLSNYAQEIAPKSAQRLVEIETVMSAANGKDRSNLAIKRIEKLWICDRSSGMRGDIAKIARTPDRIQQMSLFD